MNDFDFSEEELKETEETEAEQEQENIAQKILDEVDATKQQELVKSLEKLTSRIDKLETNEKHLSKIEKAILNNMDKAVRSGDAKAVQDMLDKLASNPEMIKPVMNALKARLELNSNNVVSWERGSDNNGRNFVRLNVTSSDGVIKMNCSISSDGKNHADVTKRGWTEPRKADIDDALRFIGQPGRKQFPPVEAQPVEIRPRR